MSRCSTSCAARDYKRHGTTTLFAALEVLDGRVIGQCFRLETLSRNSLPGGEICGGNRGAASGFNFNKRLVRRAGIEPARPVRDKGF